MTRSGRRLSEPFELDSFDLEIFRELQRDGRAPFVAIAERLGPEKQLLLVPGNHDHGLVRDWALAQGPGLRRENVVPPDASPLLARVASWLTATQLEVHYPGLWLADGVWARHWYSSVETTTSFQPYAAKPDPVPERLQGLLDVCQSHYETLYAERLGR